MHANHPDIHSRRKTISGYLYAALAAVLWSLIAPLSKNALAAGISPVETSFWRALLGCLCFAVQTSLTGGLRVPVRHALIFILFGGWGVSILFSALQLSIQLSGAATAMVLLYTAPAWVAVASYFLFREAISAKKIIAICVALTGAILVSFSGGSLPTGYSTLGIICGLISGLAYASHFPFYVWWYGRYSTATIYTYMLFGGALFLLPFVDFAPAKSWDTWGNLVALAFLTNYLAYLAIAKSLQLISQVQSAVIGNIEPVLATLLVWAFFGENFNIYGWIGCTLVICAVFLLTLERKPSETKR
ncbi:EamA family transporter [Microvirga sp. W0021]|uniref:EamA family transporter n=1 Tax=Hohaiivirga grylli TaxID=3133970 RepID=A0ABV0BIG5_9HYPH